MGVSGVLGIYHCLQQITKLLSEDADGAGMLSNDFSSLWTNSAASGLQTNWAITSEESLNPDAAV